MKIVVLAALCMVAMGAPQYGYQTPSQPVRPPPQPAPRSQPTYGIPASASTRQSAFDSVEQIPILRDDRVHEDDGSYTVDVETGNGIILAESGSPDGPEGTIVTAGEFSYTAPDGTPISLQYVADENGFQPEGDHLPVAPEFPHEIPQFVLDQIAKAAEEDAAAARAEAASVRQAASVPAPAPSLYYGPPQ